MLPCSLWAESIFLVFRSLHLPLDTQFWTWGFPHVMQSRKADLPLATRARKRERCLRGTYRDWFGSKILSQFFFVVFSGNHFFPRFMLPCSLWAENVFLVFRSLHVPLDTQFWTRGFPLRVNQVFTFYHFIPPCNAISEGRPPLSNTSSEAGALPS